MAAALAAGVIVIAVTMHLTAPGKTALGRAAAHSVAVTHHPATPAHAQHRQCRPATPARARPARPRAVPPAPRSAAVRPTVLLSQGHHATASSLEGYPWAAANAVNGNTTTRWSSAWRDPQWLEVNLGAPHALRKVVLDWENAYATAFQIQISTNGRAWRPVYSTSAGIGGLETIRVRGTGRYVRMYGTHRATGYGYSLWEFQVFGR